MASGCRALRFCVAALVCPSSRRDPVEGFGFRASLHPGAMTLKPPTPSFQHGIRVDGSTVMTWNYGPLRHRFGAHSDLYSIYVARESMT